ncbi:MAG: hypothetical protein A2176_14985 [Spirochaetes bacterium RBG_13_51_14]|nr:MAG: hypothetical protein A2176_14985 [Spirochaetes bacterium RBG_13_51_14]
MLKAFTSKGLIPTIIASLLMINRDASARIQQSGLTDMTETFREISDFLQGIHSFLSGIAFISETIGFSTIVLIVTVIVFSTGISAVGVPRGTASFLASLAAANTLWILWKMSFKAPPVDYIPMIKSNLIVLTPLVAAVLTPKLIRLVPRGIRHKLSSLTRRKGMLDARLLQELYREYQANSARLNSSILADVLDSDATGSVNLSPKTRAGIDAMKETIARLDPNRK